MHGPDARARIVIASRLYEPEAGAAAFRIAAVARALGRGHDVTVLTTRPPSGSPDEPGTGPIRVSRAPVLRDRSGAIRGYLQYLSFDIPLFVRLLLRGRADVMVAEAPPTTGLVTLLAARLTRSRFVYYPGDVWTDGMIAMGASGLLVRIMRAVESLVVRRADLLIAVSPEIIGRFAALGARVERVAEVGNGIDVDVFGHGVEPMPAERPYFVYTGTMSEWQRPELFVEALALLGDEGRSVDLRFFGQGASEAAVRESAERLLPGRVMMTGWVPPAVAARWISGAVGALVSIVPGIGYDFARPTKTYAAAAAGTPVLFAGPETGAAVVRDAGLGETVPFDAVAVAQAMRRLLEADRAGETERLRARRSAWAADTVSLRAVGERAAAAVLGALRGPRRRGG